MKWNIFICDKRALPLFGSKSSNLFRIRVSFSNEPFHHLGFLNLINTVSGNCLVSDLEQHAFLLAFLAGGVILYSLGQWDSSPAGLMASVGSFYWYPKGFSPSDLSSVPSPAYMLIHWWAGIAGPASLWMVCEVVIAPGEGMWSWATVGYYTWEPAAYLLPQKNLVTWEAALSHHPVTVLSISGFSSFLKEFLIQALTANSTGVVRQPVT